MPTEIPKMRFCTIQFGCDPEFFFEKAGKIVGSEKIIDINKGIEISPNEGGNRSVGKGQSKFIVDGVQAELNPRPDTCRARLGNEISTCFRVLAKQIKADPSLSINFAPTVKITSEELDSLDEKSKTFGCMPSKNARETGKSAVKLRDPKIYKYRSAGGHIHISPCNDYGDEKTRQAIFQEPERLVTIMDIIVGNTCVLLDRDPSNKERRKVYGRAGEYRTPSHGLEYRTLSNFWLRAYPLMSFVMALTRLAVSIRANSINSNIDYEKELLNLVNLKQIQKAINNNDFDLAKKNFKKIKEYIEDYVGADFPLNREFLPMFNLVVKKGLDFFFKEDPLKHWINLPEGHECGWETFLYDKVKPLMLQKQKGI